MLPSETEKSPAAKANSQNSAGPWYKGVTTYQWLILIIASAGWVFDAFEGQIFNITRNQLLSDLLPAGGSAAEIKKYGDQFLAIFLIGGTAGGLLFGSLADKWGRRPTMAVTILMYSVFSGLTFFAANLWQVGALRFLVAMGVGGEWAVAASLVAEIFPQHSRAHASGIFHATSILGTWTAALAGMAVGAHWRYAYLVGIIPALLILWVRSSVREPESWQAAGTAAAKGEGRPMGSFRDLLFNPRWSRRALLGMLLAAIGLGSFWGVTVAGQDLAKEFLVHHGATANVAAREAKFAYGIIETAGGGLGLLAFGPICVRLGRRRAFGWMHLGAFLITPITCYLPGSYAQLLCLLPIFGFLTLSIHAGYAIYFPELFPTHLRATGTGFCFNGGRIIAASILVLSGTIKSLPGMDLRLAMTLLAFLFPLGMLVIYFMPETKGQPLPE
jgi:MFS family permease